MRYTTCLIWTLLLLGGCAPPPPPPPAEPPQVPSPFVPAEAWTARPGVPLRAGNGLSWISHPLTRLEVLGPDSLGLAVRCATCPGAPAGTVARDDLLFSPLSPELAARASLAEFALAVRHAAARHDLDALRLVMVPGFSFSFVGPQGREDALRTWEWTRFQQLDSVPALLDRGLATRDSVLWAAPPEHFERLGYRGMRLGFRPGADGRWEWIFLIRGEQAP